MDIEGLFPLLLDHFGHLLVRLRGVEQQLGLRETLSIGISGLGQKPSRFFQVTFRELDLPVPGQSRRH